VTRDARSCHVTALEGEQRPRTLVGVDDRGRALSPNACAKHRWRWLLAVSLAVVWSVGCREAARGIRRLTYDYPAERQKCDRLTNEAARVGCRDDVAEAQEQAIDPVAYVAKQVEQRRYTDEVRREQAERDRILARCPTAQNLIARAFAQQVYAQAYKITKESEGVCPNGEAIRATLVSEVRMMSPREVARAGSDDIARLYWRPVGVLDWMDAAARGTFISDRGVYIPGTVEQQFDEYAVLEVSETIRVVLRLDRPRLFQEGQPLYVIGRFVEIGRFALALGTRVDLPVFELVYF